MAEQIPDLSAVSEVESKKSLVPAKFLPVLLVVLVVGLGIFSGYWLAGRKKAGFGFSGGKISQEQIIKGREFGAKDASVFKDTAIGVLEKGGMDGEGTHHLIREGGPSQTVYLTSSILDLDQFEGRKIQIWGETFKAQKAGWLMDVGRVKILE